MFSAGYPSAVPRRTIYMPCMWRVLVGMCLALPLFSIAEVACSIPRNVPRQHMTTCIRHSAPFAVAIALQRGPLGLCFPLRNIELQTSTVFAGRGHAGIGDDDDDDDDDDLHDHSLIHWTVCEASSSVRPSQAKVSGPFSLGPRGASEAPIEAVSRRCQHFHTMCSALA